jgi:hypothetical protein
MVSPFDQALATWQGFYTLLGTVAATLLGLLFVAVSLRLNIFHEQQVRDVRDFALLTFGSFFCLILIAGVFLIPHQNRFGVGLPLILLGLMGASSFIYVGFEFYHLNADANALPWWLPAAYGLTLLPYLGLMTLGILLLGGHTDALGWLVLVDAGLLTVATFSAWILLSHAS